MALIRNFGIPQADPYHRPSNRRSKGRRSKGRSRMAVSSSGSEQVSTTVDKSNKPEHRPSLFRYRAIPVPKPEDLGSVVSSVEALKEVVETLIGQRHDTAQRSMGRSVILDDLRKDGSQKDTADIRDYLRRVPHTIPSMEPDPHPQYATKKAALATFSLAAYGGLGGAATISGLSAAWNPVTNYPNSTVAVPRHVTVDQTAGTLSVDTPGVYGFSVNFSMEFTGSNSGRTFFLRMYNVNDGTVIATPLPVYVGRNQEGVNFSLVTLLDVTTTGVDDSLRLEAGGTVDSFGGEVLQSAGINFFGIGEYRGEI